MLREYKYVAGIKDARILPIAFDGENPEEDEDPMPNFDLSLALKSKKAKSALTEWAEREVASGLKTKNSELIDKMKKYRIGGTDDKPEYIDPEKARLALERMAKEPENLQEEVSRAVEDANRRSQQTIDELTKKSTDFETAAQKERGLRHEMMRDYELKNELIDSGIKLGKMHLHQRYLREYVVVEEENGKEVVSIIDDEGNVRYGASGRMTLKEFVKEYSSNKDVAEDWNPDTNSGSGHQPGTRGRGATPPADLSPAAKLTWARNNAANHGQMRR